MLFFSCCKIEHLLRVFNQHRALSFRLRNVKSTREHGHLSSSNLFHHSLWLPSKYHALHHSAPREAAPHNFHYANVVDIKVLRICGHDR